jgi:5-methylcytosine-specific restriction endonuclease McrA
MPRQNLSAEITWESERLLESWRNRVPYPSFFELFERLVRAANPESPKTCAQHERDSGIRKKYIRRPARVFADLGLVQLVEAPGGVLRFIFDLPIRHEPPADYDWAALHEQSWLNASRPRRRPQFGQLERLRQLDHGLCAYCVKPVRAGDGAIAHVCPHAKHGADEEENLVLAHKACNLRAWHLPPDSRQSKVSVFRGRMVSAMRCVERDGRMFPEFDFAE